MEVFNPDTMFASGHNKTVLQILSFKDYVALGRHESLNGFYMTLIQNWLSIVGRDQLFILNMATLLIKTTDTMARLKTFLELDTGWGNVQLPHENDSSHLELKLDCSTYELLKAVYEKKNRGVWGFINNSRLKPPTEPIFPAFESPRYQVHRHNNCIHHFHVFPDALMIQGFSDVGDLNLS